MALPQPHADLSTEELFRRYAPFVARFLFRLGVRSDGLDDVVQDVFVVVHRRGGYKAGPAKPTSYLATIATNAASAYRRKQHAQRTRSSDTEVETLVSTNKGPVQILEAIERLRLLQLALDRLEPDFRSTLILADIEGESCTSIAASMGVPTGTIYWRLHEARKRFQRALRAEEAGVPPRAVSPASREAGSEPAERHSLLGLALNPLWFLSDARRLLRTGALQPPVHYDVLTGLERHRQLAGSLALPSWAPVAIVASAAGQSVGIGILGISGVGVAGAVAIVVSLSLRAKPPAPDDDRAQAPAIARAAAVATPAATTSPGTAVAAPPEAVARTPDPVTGDQAGERVTPKRVPSDPSNATSNEPGARPTPRAGPAATSIASTDTASKPTPKPSTDDTSPAPSDTQIEAREIARAERMLSSNPAGALAIVRGVRARFKPSFLPEERDYVEVMALQGLGRADEAKAAASRFLGAYPGGAFANRVRSAMGR